MRLTAKTKQNNERRGRRNTKTNNKVLCVMSFLHANYDDGPFMSELIDQKTTGWVRYPASDSKGSG